MKRSALPAQYLKASNAQTSTVDLSSLVSGMDSTLYDLDYYQWLSETAYLLSEGQRSEMDVPNLLDEIEAMGKSQKRAISSYLPAILIIRSRACRPRVNCGR